MRKTILALALCLCLSCLAGCDQKTADAADAAPSAAPLTAAPTAAPAPTPAPTPAPVSVNGQDVPADVEDLTLTEAVADPEAIRAGLASLPQLKTVTLDRIVPDGGIAAWASAWAALEAELPRIAFVFRDRYQGVAVDAVTAFAPTALPEAPTEELEAIFTLFPNLQILDLTALSPARSTVTCAASLAPAAAVRWSDEAFGPSDSTARALTLSGPVTEEAAAAYLACFPALQEADLLSSDLTEAEGDALSAAFPQVAFRRMVTLNGRSLDSFTEELDLSGARIGDYEAFGNGLSKFPRLRRLEMHHCTLTNEQLAALRDRYPDTKIVWTVKMSRWEVRTDAVAFSTMQSSDNTRRLYSSYAQLLQYCTDLVALDLGHNNLEDVSWLESLPKLQLLILADNKIKDITPLASLKHLKYVELFMNPIRDITPLASLPELLDVNLCITRAEDLSPLLNCKKLERIWIGKQTQRYCSKESLQALLEAFPDAEYDLTSVSSTNLGWRDHPRHDAYMQMFRTNTVVEPFVPED